MRTARALTPIFPPIIFKRETISTLVFDKNLLDIFDGKYNIYDRFREVNGLNTFTRDYVILNLCLSVWRVVCLCACGEYAREYTRLLCLKKGLVWRTNIVFFRVLDL